MSSYSTPDGGKDNCPRPPSCRGRASSIKRVPKLLRSGGPTGGPPLSTHLKMIDLSASSRAQLCVTRPPSVENAPYLVAFVHSSLMISLRHRIADDAISISSP